MNQHKLIKSSFIYVVLGFLPLAINFFVAPIYTSYLPLGEYSKIALANLVSGGLIIFLGLGIDKAFSRFYYYCYKKKILLDALLTTTLISVISISLVIYVLGHYSGDLVFKYLFTNDEFTFFPYGELIFGNTFFVVLNSLIFSYYRNNEDPIKYSIFSISFFLFNLIGTLLFIYLESTAYMALLGRFIGGGVITLISLSYLLFRRKIVLRTKILKPMLKYCLPLIPYTLILFAYENLDKIIIERFFPTETLGVYHFAFLLASVVSVLLYAVFNAVAPRIYKLFSEETKEAQEEVRLINRMFHIIITLTVTLGIALVNPFIRIVIDEKYWTIFTYGALLFLIYIPQVFYVLYSVSIFYYNHTKYLPFISLVSFSIGLGVNFIFLSSFGIYAVILGLFCSKLSQVIMTVLLLRKLKINTIFHKDSITSMYLSTLILIPFAVIFILNIIYKFAPFSLINLMPLIVFLIYFFVNGLHLKFIQFLKKIVES